MTPHSCHRWFAKLTGQRSLQTLLVLPFLLQTLGMVAWASYLSYRTGQQALHDWAQHLMQEDSNRVVAHLDEYLKLAEHINQAQRVMVRSGHLNLENPGAIEQTLLTELHQHPSIGGVWYGSAEGFLRGFYRTFQEPVSWGAAIANTTDPNRLHIYRIDETSQPLEQLTTLEPYKMTQLPWYQMAMDTGRSGWTRMMADPAGAGMVIHAYSPIYAQQNLLGVFTVSLNRLELNRWLTTLGNRQIATILITESDGTLIATSTRSEPLEQGMPVVNHALLDRVRAIDSPDPLIAAIGAALENQTVRSHNNQEFDFQVQVDHENYFVHHRPYQNGTGLDWRITIALPRQYFAGQMVTHTHRTGLIAVAVLLGNLLFGLVTARWIARPIMLLHQKTQKLAIEHFSPIPAEHPCRELQDLVQAFNTMAQQAQQSMATLRSLTQKLLASEAQLTKCLEAIPVGVALHNAQGHLVYVNQVARELLHLESLPVTSEDLAIACQVYQAGTNQLYPVANLPSSLALQGKSVVVDDIELRHRDTVIALEVQGMPIWDEAQQVTYAIVVFQDVTVRKQAEKVLANYSRNLEAQVWQRTLALEREIQERQRMEHQLRESQMTQQAILTAIPDLLIRLNQQGIRLSFISGGTVKIKERANCHIQQSIYDVLPRELADLRMQHVQQALSTGKRQLYEHAIEVEGEIRYEETRIVKLNDQEVLVMVRDITNRRLVEHQLQAANAQLAQLALTDGLTQVPNRRRFDEFLQYQWNRLQTLQQSLAMILLDIDYFKRYNDTYGHPMGDDCLKQVVKQVQTVLTHPSYLLARYGGEEFAIVLPATNLAQTIALAQTISSSIRSLAIPHIASPLGIVSVSMGISVMVPDPILSPMSLIEQTDQALYIAKQQGRDRYCIYPTLLAPMRTTQEH